jgi:uncharacterized membrane protein YczE
MRAWNLGKRGLGMNVEAVWAGKMFVLFCGLFIILVGIFIPEKDRDELSSFFPTGGDSLFGIIFGFISFYLLYKLLHRFPMWLVRSIVILIGSLIIAFGVYIPVPVK